MVTLTDLGVPVESSRQFTTALAPGNSGGWRFIAQSYLYPTEVDTEWAVVNLETGAYHLDTGPVGIFANAIHSADCANFAGDQRQLRASNGKIFFPLRWTRFAVYDPATETVTTLAGLADPVNDANPNNPGNAIMRACVFGQDGHIYGSTQVSPGQQPMVWKLATNTSTPTLLGYVGNPQSGPTYGYYSAVDVTPSEDAAAGWIYIAVGESPWELWALNITTGSAVELSAGLGTIAAINFNKRAQGWEASLTIGGVPNRYWVADGLKFAGAPVYSGQFPARDVTPYSNLLANPPELDTTPGIGRVLWRQGSSGPWSEVTYQVAHVSPVPIEMLTVMPDGTLLGSTQQYQGFFRRDVANEWYGNVVGMISGPAVTVAGANKVWMAGYPNGKLYSYDPAQQWQVGTNPVQVTGGFFATSDMEFAYFLEQAYNGKVYCYGRRERDGTGGAIGCYHGGSTFTGRYDFPLNHYNPRGMAITGGQLVLSGTLVDDPESPKTKPATASVLVYGLNLEPVTSYVIVPGLTDTGPLYSTRMEGVVFGIASGLLYTLNVRTGAVRTKKVSSTGASCRRSDGLVWAVVDRKLVVIQPENFDIVSSGDLSITPEYMAGDQTRVYMSVGATLYSTDFSLPSSFHNRIYR